MGAPIYQNGVRQWVWFSDINFDDSDFGKVGADFSDETGLIVSGKVGLAKGQLMPQKQLVDYAVRWMEKNRT